MILLKTSLIGAAFLASMSYGMAQQRYTPDGDPPAFGHRYNWGAYEMPYEYAAPGAIEGRSVYAPGYGHETIVPGYDPYAGAGSPTDDGY